MDTRPTETAARRPLRASITLALVVTFAAGLLALVYDATRERIAEAERDRRLARFAAVLGDTRHDNELLEDVIEVNDADLLGTDEPVRVFRARLAHEPVAAVILPVAPDGYGGSIRLVVGIDPTGRLLGVRVFSHHETPGLGDGIDERKSNWILAFNGRSLNDPTPDGWKVRKDGGQFDQFTGATVTARAVVTAVRNTLAFFEENRDNIFAEAPPETDSVTSTERRVTFEAKVVDSTAR